jgi:protein-tyrosine-phosphatase
VAEALLKKSRPDIDVDSAGTHTAIPISNEALRYLATEDAEDYLKKIPEDLDSKQLWQYDVIVAMKTEHRDAVLRKCPKCANRIVVWDIDDPYFLPEEYTEQIFKQIKAKIQELANTL